MSHKDRGAAAAMGYGPGLPAGPAPMPLDLAIDGTALGISRRRFLAGGAMAAGGVILAACAPSAPSLRPSTARQTPRPAAFPEAADPSTSAAPIGSPSVAAVSPAPVGAGLEAPYRRVPTEPVRVRPDRLPYRGGKLISLAAPPFPVDSHGIRLRRLNGVLYYNPVALAQQGLGLVDAYEQTQDDRYRDLAIRVADKLRSMARRSPTARPATFFPYDADFFMHGRRTERIRAPWYSSMAQGMIVSFFVRLAAIQESTLLKDASAALSSLIPNPIVPGRPWVSTIDRDRYLWLEEYPTAHDHTLNGFMFTMFGIYDLWLATSDPVAMTLFQGGTATLRHFLPRFENPGGISFYCLKHHVMSAGYHGTHVWQLRMMGRMTGDGFFTAMSKRFFADHH
jgi:hypothetical protein